MEFPSVAWLLFMVAGLATHTHAYFCSRFFLDIKDRTPFSFTVNDSTPVGSQVASFPGSRSSRQAVTFTSGDLKYLNYDTEDMALKVMAPLYSQIDRTLTIYGTCVDFISLIAYEINIPVSMTVSVVDMNDAPVFSNLPATLSIPEGTRPGPLNFTVDIDSSFDKRPEFIRTDLRITSVTSDANHIGEPPFRLRDSGTLELLYILDYETGPRAYNVTFQATDYGRPPMTNSSFLLVMVGDVDDMAPAFNRAQYEAHVVGEKPIKDRQCFSASPPIDARDQDEGLNTPVRYDITRGSPEDWSDFFRLEGGTGQLCQLATLHRNALHPDNGRKAFTNYTFTLRASQVDNPAKYDTAQLVVHVRDANEHAPMFERGLYQESVPEFPRTRKGGRILQIQATDMDHGLNSIFEYSLSPDAYPTFVIDPKSGWITLNNHTLLDREDRDTIEFMAFARETESLEPRLDECRVVVTIEDINDNRPQFRSRSYNYTILDTLRAGLTLHRNDKGKDGRAVEATDADQGDNGRLQYRITNVWRRGGRSSLTDLGRFTIDPDKGAIRLAGTLNDLRRHKEHPTYKLKVLATDRARNENQRKSAHTYVFVNVVEANEHAPVFNGDRSDNWLNESVPIGTIITDLEVTDADGDEDMYLTYEVTKGNEEGQFDFINGGRLVLAKPLDRERHDNYKLNVRVSDGLHMLEIPVGVHVTDVNDNAPRFTAETYMFHVPEEPEVGTVLGRVSAYDLDLGQGGRVRYDLQGDLPNTVLMLEQDGSLVVRTLSASLDTEQNSQMRFRVVASDHGIPSRNSSVEVTLVLEDRNDNPPAFPYPVYYGWVQEDDMSPKPQVVHLETTLNATDADVTSENRDVRYFLSGDGSDTFELDPVHADLVVRRPGGLDCETMAEYSLQVKAVDHAGSGLSADTTLVIQVRDENDHAPEFQLPAIFRTSPDVKTNAIIGKVTAKDDDVTKPNNDVIYLLKKGGYGKFGVDYRSGDIYLADDLGREPVMSEYQLQIEALDGGLPRRVQQALISIQVPYKLPPRILPNSTYIQVRENLPPLTTVGRLVAHDSEGPQDTLVFFTKDLDVPFVVSKQGHVRTKRPLDREMAPAYEFDVYVSDGGQPPRTSSARVTVTVDDVNDSAPRFTLLQYEGHILEDNRDPKPGQEVRMSADIAVVDMDRGGTRHMRFTLQGDARTLFNIDTHTGALRVSERAAGQIDRERREFFQLKLVATDENGYGLSAQADITIYIDDVNDEVPEFTNRGAQFYVYEDVETGRPIGKLSAVDPDATEPNNKIIYLLESDSIGKFSVDPYTGAIIPLKGLFYKPRYQTYVLRVAAMDLGYPNRKTTDRVHVHMHKQTFNDHRPEFRSRTVFTVNEEVPLGTLVGTVKAVDLDVGPGEGLTLEIVNQRPAVPFKIHPQSGELRSTARLDADDSGEPMYSFVVRAKDHGDPPLEALAHVSVIVEDVNDNPPVFTQPLYHHYASAHYPPGTAIATPFAHDDIDSGDSTYRYSMTGEGAGSFFTINPTTGIVQTTVHLVHINVTQVRYDVIAQDIYNPRLFAHTMLIINILELDNEASCTCT